MAYNKREKTIPADIYNGAVEFSNMLGDKVASLIRTIHPEDQHIIEREEALQMALNAIGPKVLKFNEENRGTGYMLIQKAGCTAYIPSPATKMAFRVPSVDEISVKLSFTSGGTPQYVIATPGSGPGGDRQNITFYAGNKDPNADPDKGIVAIPQPVNLTLAQLVELTANIASAVKETYDAALASLDTTEKPSIESANRAIMEHATGRAKIAFEASKIVTVKPRQASPRDRF